VAEPTLVQVSASNHTDTSATETTASFTWQSGDVFHILGGTEDNANSLLATPSTAGSNLTFSLITATNTGSTAKAYYWRGTASGAGSGTITSAGSGGGLRRGITAWQYRGTDGQGTPQTIAASSAKTISVTRGQANSHIIEILADWNAVGDVTTDPTPAGGNQRVEVSNAGNVDFFVTDWGDQGATGTTAYGITNHTGTVNMAGIAVEILGTAGGASATRGTPFGHQGTAFNGGRTFNGILNRELLAWQRHQNLLRSATMRISARG
jgi:hypothetical protein